MRKVFAVWLVLALIVVAWGSWLRYGDGNPTEERYRSDIQAVQGMATQMRQDVESRKATPRQRPVRELANYDVRAEQLLRIRATLPEGDGKSDVIRFIDQGEKTNRAVAAYLRDPSQDQYRVTIASINTLEKG
jgi:hypothetical protein